jgi:hypothetical protein
MLGVDQKKKRELTERGLGADKDRKEASGGKVVHIGHPREGVHNVKDCIY